MQSARPPSSAPVRDARADRYASKKAGGDDFGYQEYSKAEILQVGAAC